MARKTANNPRLFEVQICGYQFGMEANGLPKSHVVAAFATLAEARRFCRKNGYGVIHKPDGIEIP